MIRQTAPITVKESCRHLLPFMISVILCLYAQGYINYLPHEGLYDIIFRIVPLIFLFGFLKNIRRIKQPNRCASHKTCIMTNLVLSGIGLVCHVYKPFFEEGMTFFAFGHLCLFYTYGVFPVYPWIMMTFMAPFAECGYHVAFRMPTQRLQYGALIYGLILTLNVWRAWTRAYIKPTFPRIANGLASLLFILSDMFLARTEFLIWFQVRYPSYQKELILGLHYMAHLGTALNALDTKPDFKLSITR